VDVAIIREMITTTTLPVTRGDTVDGNGFQNDGCISSIDGCVSSIDGCKSSIDKCISSIDEYVNYSQVNEEGKESEEIMEDQQRNAEKTGQQCKTDIDVIPYTLPYTLNANPSP